MAETELHRLPTGTAPSIAAADVAGFQEPILRRDGTAPDVRVLHDLMEHFRETRMRSGASRQDTDGWLVPRVHWAFRLTRAEASDKGTWHWLAAGPLRDYVEWRWGTTRPVEDTRWVGGINKQAVARLWWGAELIRDGSDYSLAVQAFTRMQDIPHNSLHRPFMRCRPMALQQVRAMLTEHQAGRLTRASRSIRSFQRMANAVAVGTPPEQECAWTGDRPDVYRQWLREELTAPPDWEQTPVGPDDAGGHLTGAADAATTRILSWAQEKQPAEWGLPTDGE